MSAQALKLKLKRGVEADFQKVGVVVVIATASFNPSKYKKTPIDSQVLILVHTQNSTSEIMMHWQFRLSASLREHMDVVPTRFRCPRSNKGP